MIPALQDDETFWRIIQAACMSDASSVERWNARLVDELAALPAKAIIGWDARFHALAERAHRTDLWAAAHLINGGTTAVGFFEFRCWLIGMGSQVYAAALSDPDSLADVVRASWDPRGIDAEAKIDGAARQAWMNVTGGASNDYPALVAAPKHVEAVGDLDDTQRMERQFPRLFSILAQT